MTGLLRRGARLDDAGRAALARVLEDPTFELIPLKNVRDQAAALPRGAEISVTASPGKGIEATVELAIELEATGLRPIPHLSARMIRDRAQLSALLRRLSDAGIDRAFVVGGDADEPGEFLDGLSLLRAMQDLGQVPRELGCPCYPQGHPDIPDDVLAQALRDKAPLVQYMTTQLCFDPSAIATFVADRRSEGIELPVKLGIPGVAEIPKLMSVSARIGVKDASKFVLRNYRFVGQLLRSGGIYKPSRLMQDLAPVIADPAARVVGLHVYTFNNVPATVAWRDELRGSVTA
ncbi:MAG TPA: methylenetetrahydrofolate reductase [Candidatus Limnocylindrales bacterium]|nr:methylenetetrahydrofolate reductase [Candidatus Limnocylindrales bacterium]